MPTNGLQDILHFHIARVRNNSFTAYQILGIKVEKKLKQKEAGSRSICTERMKQLNKMSEFVVNGKKAPENTIGTQ